MENLNVKNYNGEELYKIQLIKDINLGNYEELNNDCDGELPNNIININGEAIIKKALYYIMEKIRFMDRY